MDQAGRILGALGERFAAEGLHILLPLSRQAFDAVSIARSSPRMDELLPDGRSAVLVADGGPSFFGRFRAAVAARGGLPDASPNPLDDFTRSRTAVAIEDVLVPLDIRFRLLYPFGGGSRPLPFQRLGQAAGLPAPGPLGIQIHPHFGPWWAYRALVVTSLALEPGPQRQALCAGCDRPCVRDCAVHPSGGAGRGIAVEIPCGDACGARDRCPIGSAHRYSADQVAFHARARQAMLRGPAFDGS